MSTCRRCGTSYDDLRGACPECGCDACEHCVCIDCYAHADEQCRCRPERQGRVVRLVLRAAEQ